MSKNLVSPWRLVDQVAEFTCGMLSGRIDLKAPQLGVTGLNWNNGPTREEFRGSLWELRPAERSARLGGLDECYVRGDDLVASFRPGKEFPYRVELSWTVASVGEAVVMKHLVSVQTLLLNTQPELLLTSRAPGDCAPAPGCELDEAACWLQAPEEKGLAVWEAIHPSDWLAASQSEAMPQNSSERPIVGHFMEKGVIRRVRLLAGFCPASCARELCRQVCHEFVDAPLPLTT